MAKSKTLAVLISANGYGHIRRQILVAEELLHRFFNLKITFALTDKQYQRFKAEIETLGKRVDTAVGVTEESVRWRHSPESYSDSNLNGWETEWRSNSKLFNSDFVISDNLVGVLEERPDAILSGSFLWHEVIANYSVVNKSCKKFVDRELSLLLANKPTMICNKSLASDAVLKLTNPVAVSWMVNGTSQHHNNIRRTSILVHGGGTRTLDKKVLEIAKLLRLASFRVFTDIEDDECYFDYEDETWGTLGVVVCRPGAGTATECVKWKIPMVVIRDLENTEAEHIAERLSTLGLAHGFSDAMSSQAIADLAEDILSGNRSTYYLSPFENCSRTGIRDAVDFLESHWNLDGNRL